MWFKGNPPPDTKLLFVLPVPLCPSAPPTRTATLAEALDVVWFEQGQRVPGQRVGQVPADGDREQGRLRTQVSPPAGLPSHKPQENHSLAG